MKLSVTSAFFVGSALMLSPVPSDAQMLAALSGFERSLTLNHVLTTASANIPPGLLAPLIGGALEVREQTNYNPQLNALTSTIFVVEPSAPSPTNLALVPPLSILGGATTSVDRIYITSKPVPAVQLAGTITQSSATLFGSFLGAPLAYSFGYTSDTPPKIMNVVEAIAGLGVLYSSDASGTFTITQPPGGGGGGGGGMGITLVLTGPGGVSSSTNSFQTVGNLFALDASKTTSSNAGPLTFAWTPMPGYPSVGISGGSTGTPTVQLSSGFGTYKLGLTVTDSTGLTATATITIQYL
jgi:hypothetical protein